MRWPTLAVRYLTLIFSLFVLLANKLLFQLIESTRTPNAHLCFSGEDTMTGDGGEYLRAEDLRELGDDSLPGHYLDFSYMNNMNIDR